MNKRNVLAMRRVRSMTIKKGLARRMAGRRRWPRPRWVVAVIGGVAVAVATFLFVGSGSAPTGPRELTSDQASRLAVTRFLNYQAGGRAMTINVPGTAGGLSITGSIDYRREIGYGAVHGTGRDTSSDGLIQWTATTVSVHPMANAPAKAPARPPESGWSSRPLQKYGSSLDSSLAIALKLGSDRPDNAELLPQNGAAWVGQDRLDGHRVDIMTGPTARATPGTAGTGDVRYWIGSDGTMYRVRVGVASASRPVVIDFDTQKYVPVRPVPGVAPAR